MCVRLSVCAVYLWVSMHVNNPPFPICAPERLTSSCRLYNLGSSQTRCVYLHHPPSFPPYHPGDRRIAKWSQSSCTTEATAGTATTASPAPAATRSCWMEPASSWTSTPPRTTTCWMGTLPPQVGSTGYQIPPPAVWSFWASPSSWPRLWWTPTLTVQSDSLNPQWASHRAASWNPKSSSKLVRRRRHVAALVMSHPTTNVKTHQMCVRSCALLWRSSSTICPLLISMHTHQLLCVPSCHTLQTPAPISTEATVQMVMKLLIDFWTEQKYGYRQPKWLLWNLLIWAQKSTWLSDVSHGLHCVKCDL